MDNWNLNAFFIIITLLLSWPLIYFSINYCYYLLRKLDLQHNLLSWVVCLKSRLNYGESGNLKAFSILFNDHHFRPLIPFHPFWFLCIYFAVYVLHFHLFLKLHNRFLSCWSNFKSLHGYLLGYFICSKWITYSYAY